MSPMTLGLKCQGCLSGFYINVVVLPVIIRVSQGTVDGQNPALPIIRNIA